MRNLARHIACAAILCCLRCDTPSEPARPEAPRPKPPVRPVEPCDRSLLFVGNSHTYMHDIPNLVRRMIEFRHPGEKVLVKQITIGFLEDLQNNKAAAKTLASRKWDVVILQAQKISQSGRYKYSQQAGIDFAIKARAAGSRVLFYCEWGLKGISGDAKLVEGIYAEMAKAADAELAPVGRAWDAALAQRPDIALHAADGNHQTELGAYLTACALFACITHESPIPLSQFPYEHAEPADRAFLAEAADRAMKKE